MICNYFLSSWVVFSLCWWCPLKHKFLICWNLSFSCLFFLLSLAHLVSFIKRLCLTQGQRLIPMFSSKSFTVTVLVFRFMIHCELIFVYGVKKGFKLILLNVDIQLFQHYLLKRALLPHWIVLVSLWKVKWHKCNGLFFRILFLFHWFSTMLSC